MAQRKIEDQHARTLTKNGGGSISVTLPIEFVRALKWRDGQKVVVRRMGSKLLIADWKR